MKNILLDNDRWVADHGLNWLNFMAACDEAIALAEPLTDADRKLMRDALEAEAARMVAAQHAARGRVC